MATTTYTPYVPPTIDIQARLLSSGTMGTLTGKSKYAELDPVQADFVEFCEENRAHYATWQAAWNDFRVLLPFKTPCWEDEPKAAGCCWEAGPHRAPRRRRRRPR